MKVFKTKVIIDTNILFNDFLHRYAQFGLSTSKKELNNRRDCNNAITIIRNRRYIKTIIADFALMKVISLMDKTKVPKSIQVAEIEYLQKNHTIVPLNGTLITKAVNEIKKNQEVKDIEDAMQYTLASTHNCSHLLTLNTRDFTPFDIKVIKPDKARLIY
ncbi:PIN domain-containing protein [Arcicella aquatica]|uniref:PIN domain-containing protein n=1 Tax=Arcicella aquatica TaxID=217141 RepID=A0ABU5QKM3_9BACT|nr:PIN domain-containing protein [Arcicella aquatica]MEA5257610.1 PIN domain-containing protein [Arcicella aquatica]